MKALLIYLWQLPQNLLALLIFLFFKTEKSLMYKGIKVHVSHKFPGGLSLGNHILVKVYPHNEKTWKRVKHEYGHTRQSVRWGWMYLIVLGIPSLLGAIESKYLHTEKRGWTKQASDFWYFNQPWEKQADELGGVER